MRSGYEDRFAVIGAGFAGLGVAGALKRHGVDFDIIEADDALGGNWYHGVYETAHIISSRKTTQYTEYPMPGSYGDFPSAANMLRYFNDYTDHFDLRRHLQLNTRVTCITPCGESEFELELAHNGQTETRVYGGVVICNGHHWDKRFPDYPGEFSGQIMHSKDYKKPDALRGKRVLVIGGGNSACDIAVEAARFADESHISMRRGYWFMPKTFIGRPSVEYITPLLPVWVQRQVVKGMVRVAFGRYEDLGLQTPDHRVFEKHPTVNSELLYYLKHKRVTPHPDLDHYDGHEVIFVDGSRVAIDLIICATGYHLSVPFLAAGIIRVENYMPNLIAGVFHPAYKNLYYLGAGQPRYGAGPLISAGAEGIARVIIAQREMQRPAGKVLQQMGVPEPDNVLVDPHAALFNARLLQQIAPRLPLIEKALFPA